MKRKILAAIILVTTLFFSSCDVLRQVEEMTALSSCKFRIHTVTDINLAGVNVSNIQSFSDIRPLDVLQLTNAVLNNQLPLNFNLNLQVNNPNNQTASMNKLDWILFIDDLQMLNGSIQERFTTEPNSTATLPVNIAFNLAEVLQGKQGEKIIDFALGLADGSGKTSRVMVKLKPYIMVSGRNLDYPGWIEVRNDFVAK
jgi:hypothetical protein